MTSTIIGVDIGAAGALALVDEAGELLEVADMPILATAPRTVLPSMAPCLPRSSAAGAPIAPSSSTSALALARAQSGHSPSVAVAAS